MITCRLAGLLLALLVLSPPCEAVSPERGRLLYDNFCYHCHISQIHHRAGSDIRAWADLIRAVANWQAEMGLGWTAEDVVDVASWLDSNFYGLADAPRAQ
jgi:hypothetical protein